MATFTSSENHPFGTNAFLGEARIEAAEAEKTYPASNRVFDIAVSVYVTISILIWLIPLISFIIRLTSRGPIMFVQLRTGRGGKEFWCLKFRTMSYDKNSPFIQPARNDVRITPIGRFLRRTNFDEMPQFLNVLAGDMSVVGPRPHPLPLDAKYWDILPGFAKRYAVKPGITGLAQVRTKFTASNSELQNMRNRLRYDLFYIKHKSFLFDLKICFWTIKSALSGYNSTW